MNIQIGDKVRVMGKWYEVLGIRPSRSCPGSISPGIYRDGEDFFVNPLHIEDHKPGDFENI